MTELYVGNLLYEVTLEEVRALFSPYGEIYSLDLFTEVEPDHPHAYAFVLMANDVAEVVQRTLDRSDFMGRTLRVEKAEAVRVRSS